MAKIVLLEDNVDWQEFARDTIRKAAGPDVELVVLETEHGFVEAFDGFRKSKPSLFIIDVMVPWAEPSPNVPPPPPPVLQNGFFRAGKRCQRLLTTDERLKDVPIIFWTVVGEADLKRDFEGEGVWPENACYVAKDTNDLDKLARKIRKYLGAS